MEVTDKAAKTLRRIATKEGYLDDFALRVGVKGGGCSGLLYVLAIEEDRPNESDRVIDDNDIKVFIDKKSYVFLAGTQLDFSDGLNGKGFVFENPNANRSCGCGNSFGV
ncbi:iron-sulfur cluster assembly accessory protein [SAR202 cluster bacterium AC-409-J13_OGT_754m]|nr:iron-sulfur cluster assembly accessory protein [SAR202 cluster bacterium AC-409-J13_OGT_754m]